MIDSMRGLLKQLRALFSKRSVERELDDELAFHIDMETAKNERLGYSPAEARRRALLDFGGTDRHRAGVYEARWTHWLDDLGQDVRYAVRSLLRQPSFLIVGGVTLALGIGATTAVFSITSSILFTRPAVRDPENLVIISEQRSGRVSTSMGFMMLPYERIVGYREGSRPVFSDVAAERMESVALRAGADSRPEPGALVSGNYFSVLGLQPALGQFFQSDRDQGVVISHALWQARFQGARDVIGRPVSIDSRAYTIVGVAPPQFRGTMQGLVTDLWIPVHAHQREQLPWFLPIARLKPGMRAEAASSFVSGLALQIPVDDAGTKVSRAMLYPLTGTPGGKARTGVIGFFSMLLVTALIVLLIGAANLASLLITRGLSRERELGLRRAIGAARSRVVRQLLTETVILFLFGGLLGLALAYGITSVLQSLSLPIPVRVELRFTPDLRILGFGLTLAAVTGLVFGLVPALRSSRPDLMTVLKQGTAASGLGRSTARTLFVVGQLSMAVLLMVVTGLFVRTLQNSLAADPGFDVNNVVVATTNLEPHGYDEARARAFYEQLVERVRALPGVESVALSNVILMSGSSNGNDVETMAADSAVRLNTSQAIVDGEYFQTLKIPVVSGRVFNERDVREGARVAVINQVLADRLWPRQNPLGRHFRDSGLPVEVIGVTRNGKYVSLREDERPFVFFSTTQRYEPRMTVHVRTRDNAGAALGQIADVVRAIDSNIAVEEATTLAAATSVTIYAQRIAAMFIGSFSLLGLILASVGVYGIVSTHVAQRNREFGIRVALGAHPRQVVRLVLRRGVILVAAGVGIGVLLASQLTRFLQAFIFNVSALDPVTFLGTALLLGGIALLASYIPARRATRVDPMIALRAE